MQDRKQAKTRGCSLLQGGFEKRPISSWRSLTSSMMRNLKYYFMISSLKSTKYLPRTKGFTNALLISLVMD